MIKEIATFILNQTTVSYWARDVNFFAGHLPVINSERTKLEEIPRVACILENVPAALVGDLPDRQDKQIQIWNRAESYFKARDDANEFFQMLHGSTQWALPQIGGSGEEYFAMIIDGVASPAPIENPDEKGRFVFSTNYLFKICE